MKCKNCKFFIPTDTKTQYPFVGKYGYCKNTERNYDGRDDHKTNEYYTCVWFEKQEISKEEVLKDMDVEEIVKYLNERLVNKVIIIVNRNQISTSQ